MKQEKVRLHTSLLESLEPFMPTYCSSEQRWQNYRVIGENPMPLVVKAPIGEILAEGTVVYDAVTYSRKGGRCRAEKDRPTLDHLELRLYPKGEGEALAELRYAECGRNEEITFSGQKPLKVIYLEGKGRKGRIVFCAPNASTCVEVWEEKMENLFDGSATIHLLGCVELQLRNCLKMVAQNENGKVEVYDHRHDRSLSVARVEHLRKTVGAGYSFEFYNLWDSPENYSEVSHALTNEGISKLS